MDALEKSNTKLTEEVRELRAALGCPPRIASFMRTVCLSPQLAVANNRIITLQEDVERVKEESSYQLESRKVSPSIVGRLYARRGFKSFSRMLPSFSGSKKRLGLRWTSAGRNTQAAQRGNAATIGSFRTCVLIPLT